MELSNNQFKVRVGSKLLIQTYLKTTLYLDVKNLKLFSELSIVVFVLLLSISCSDNEPTPKVEVIIEGGYTGGWNSITSTGPSYSLGVSAVLVESDGFYSGPFFITTKFEPAYGQIDDGFISFKVKNDSISNFFYTDTIPGCEGSFNGKGIVDSDGKFLITFTGNDCDGSHNGTIFLEKAK